MRVLLPLVVVVLAGLGLWLVFGDGDSGGREAAPYEGDYSAGGEGERRTPGMGAEASSASRVAVSALPADRGVGVGEDAWREKIIRLGASGEAGAGLLGEQVVAALAEVIPVRFVSEAVRATLYQRKLMEEGAPPEIPAGELLMLLEQGGFMGQQIGDKLWIRVIPERR